MKEPLGNIDGGGADDFIGGGDTLRESRLAKGLHGFLRIPNIYPTVMLRPFELNVVLLKQPWQSPETNSGLAAAQYDLAEMYRLGFGVTQNDQSPQSGTLPRQDRATLGQSSFWIIYPKKFLPSDKSYRIQRTSGLIVEDVQRQIPNQPGFTQAKTFIAAN